MRSRRTLDASLFALGVACWIARDDHGSGAHLGLLWGMLFDNVTVCAVLAFAGDDHVKHRAVAVARGRTSRDHDGVVCVESACKGTEADDEVNPERAA